MDEFLEAYSMKNLNQDECRLLPKLQKTNVKTTYFINLILNFFYKTLVNNTAPKRYRLFNENLSYLPRNYWLEMPQKHPNQ